MCGSPELRFQVGWFPSWSLGTSQQESEFRRNKEWLLSIENDIFLIHSEFWLLASIFNNY